MSPPLLHVAGLRVRFPDAPTFAVDGLDLDLAPGESLALVGPSGCGKTATVRAMTGLHPEGTTVRGRIDWKGEDLLDLAPDALRDRLGSGIATVFQDAGASLDPVVKVGDQLVELIRLHRRLEGDQAEALRHELFAEVSLATALAGRYPHQLSGGEQQRVALAMALVGDPELLIADEPTTALDPAIQDDIVRLLGDLAARRSMALLFITHDLRLASRVARGIAVIDGGRIVERAPADELLARPATASARALVDACRPSAIRPQDATASGPPALGIADLSVRYPGGGRPALDSVTFRLDGAEAFGLVGASGSGKSTLARALAGFMGYDGEIDPSPCGRGGPRPVQMIFQSPTSALDPRRTVTVSVRDAALAAGDPDPDGTVRALFEEVGLPAECAHRRPHALSGGQRQRVVIARALAAKPEVLVADEPASSLDLPARLALVDLLERLRRERGIALILISHDLRLVRRCCSRVGILDQGVLVEIVGGGESPTSPAGRRMWPHDSSNPDDSATGA